VVGCLYEYKVRVRSDAVPYRILFGRFVWVGFKLWFLFGGGIVCTVQVQLLEYWYRYFVQVNEARRAGLDGICGFG